MHLPIVISVLLGAATPAADQFLWDPAQNIDRTEQCAGWAMAIADGSPAPSLAVKQLYVTWTSVYAVIAVTHDMKPSDIDAHLEAATKRAQTLMAKGEGADQIVDCSQAALRTSPLPVAFGAPPRADSQPK
jgi:hypothetical protein